MLVGAEGCGFIASDLEFVFTLLSSEEVCKRLNDGTMIFESSGEHTNEGEIRVANYLKSLTRN